MKKIFPISEFQRRAGRIVKILDETEPVIISQRGRLAAVLIWASRYESIERDLERLDDLELLEMVEESEKALAEKQTTPHQAVKERLEKKYRLGGP